MCPLPPRSSTFPKRCAPCRRGAGRGPWRASPRRSPRMPRAACQTQRRPTPAAPPGSTACCRRPGSRRSSLRAAVTGRLPGTWSGWVEAQRTGFKLNGLGSSATDLVQAQWTGFAAQRTEFEAQRTGFKFNGLGFSQVGFQLRITWGGFAFDAAVARGRGRLFVPWPGRAAEKPVHPHVCDCVAAPCTCAPTHTYACPYKCKGAW